MHHAQGAKGIGQQVNPGLHAVVDFNSTLTWARSEMLTLTHAVTALLPQRAQTQHTLFTARTVPI